MTKTNDDDKPSVLDVPTKSDIKLPKPRDKAIKKIKIITHRASRSKICSQLSASILEYITSQNDTTLRLPQWTPSITTSCSKCNMLVPRNRMIGSICRWCHSNEEDPTKGLQLYHIVEHCCECQRYSFWEDSLWVQAAPRSKELLDFLLKRLEPHLRKLQLVVKDAFFSPETNSRHVINIVLVIKVYNFNSASQEITLTVGFLLRVQACPTCSSLVKTSSPSGHLNTVVLLRQYGANKSISRHLARLMLVSLSALGLVSKPTSQGMDLFFPIKRDAVNFCNRLSRLAPIKMEEASGGLITAWVSPISRDDLVYLPQRTAGLLGFGPLLVGSMMAAKVSLFDLTTLRVCSVSAEDYFRAPFEPLMTSRDLVEYVVLDVGDVSMALTFSSLMDVKVALASDTDEVFHVKSHFGASLRKGERVLGYDLRWIGNNQEKLPKLVLIKKSYERSVSRKFSTKQQRCSEYEKFLTDLEKDPATMFNVSLNSAEGESRTSEMSSEVRVVDNEELDLDDMLADLNLRGEEHAEASGI